MNDAINQGYQIHFRFWDRCRPQGSPWARSVGPVAGLVGADQLHQSQMAGAEKAAANSLPLRPCVAGLAQVT